MLFSLLNLMSALLESSFYLILDPTEYWGYDKDKALECFKEAGYEQVDGKLVKDGKQLVVEVATNVCIT